MPGLELDDLTLWYERFGRLDDGPRLLVFNGSGATIETSRPLLDKLGEVADVLVHDQRCLGRTGIPVSADDRPPTMADVAADAAALLDHVGWDRCAVFGISFGGMVAQEFAVTHPERVTRLALLCTSPG
ncbi:MAG: alpha/beta hydrolase, partial [Ilumatobacteraceae bacterium]